jgi:hypothetical protein
MFFTKLLPELLHLILEHLNYSEILRFDLAVLNHSLRSLFIDALRLLQPEFFSRPLDSLDIDWLTHRGILIPTIKFCGFNESGVGYISKFRSSIQSIEINLRRGYKASNSDLVRIGRCPLMTSLSLPDSTITIKNLEKLLKSNPQLESLSLQGCQKLTETAISTVVKYCPKLKVLNISGNLWVADDAIEILVTGCPHLTKIDLSGTMISDECIEDLLAQFPRLRSIRFSDTEISIETILKIFRHVGIPSLLDQNPSNQLLGLDCIFEVLGESLLSS